MATPITQKILNRFMQVVNDKREKMKQAKLPDTQTDEELENHEIRKAEFRKHARNLPDSLKEAVWSAPTKDGGTFVVTKKSEVKSSQDPYLMHVHDKDGNKTSHGSHASVEGAKKYYDSRLKEDFTASLDPYSKARAGQEYEHMDAEALGRKHGKAGMPAKSPYKKGSTMHGDYMRGHYYASKGGMNEESHFSAGLFDGTSGKDYNNPHAEGSKEHKHYHIGHEIGTKTRAKTRGNPPKVPGTMNESLHETKGSTAKEIWDAHRKKGVVASIDKEAYPEIKGLEGPFRKGKAGHVLYYDPKEGKYYDSKKDMYIDHEEAKGMGIYEGNDLSEALLPVGTIVKYQGEKHKITKHIDGDGGYRSVLKKHVYVIKSLDGALIQSVKHSDVKVIKESNAEVLNKNISILKKHVGGKTTPQADETPAQKAYKLGKQHKAEGKPHANPHPSDKWEHDQYNAGYGH